MRRLTVDGIFVALLLLIAMAGPAYPQGDGRTTFTGTALIYGSRYNTRNVTSTFTLHVERLATPSEADRLLRVLDQQVRTGCSMP